MHFLINRSGLDLNLECIILTIKILVPGILEDQRLIYNLRMRLSNNFKKYIYKVQHEKHFGLMPGS